MENLIVNLLTKLQTDQKSITIHMATKLTLKLVVTSILHVNLIDNPHLTVSK